MTELSRIDIGLLLYPGAQISAALGLEDLFELANRAAATRAGPRGPHLRVRQWRLKDGGPRPTLATQDPTTDVMVLPPTLSSPLSADAARPIAGWLRALHAGGAVLASVCGGAFLLGETGLLDGRRATTHWAYAEIFASRFPKVTLDADRMLIDDGDIVTAGGLMSWTEVGLNLVERFLGSATMLETAQTMLIDPPGREQRFYSTFMPKLNHGDAHILKVQHWLQATGAKDAGLPVLAARAGLEERTFLRRFQKATGLTSTDYAQRLRVGKAREHLQFGALAVDAIAWEVGYSDPAAFRKVFRRIVGLTPGDYRSRFHVRQGRPA